MKLDRETLLATPTEQAADLLYQQGKSLRGSNLKRSSWLLIAQGLHVQRISEIVLARLMAATTRQDALRVLRIARKWVRPAKTGKASRGARPQEPKQVWLAAAKEGDLSSSAYDEDEWFWDMDLVWEAELLPDYEAWLQERANSGPSPRTRHPGLRPASALQDAIDQYAWDHRSTQDNLPEDMRSHLDDEKYQRLLALVNFNPSIDLSEGEWNFLRQYAPDPLLHFVEHPQQSFHPAPIKDGFALAGLRIIEDHIGREDHPFQVDWEAIASWLAGHLTLKPQPETVSAIIPCAYAFFRDAPAPLVERFLQPPSPWQPDWTSLLWYAYQRIPELFPEKSTQQVLSPNWWAAAAGYINPIAWERILDAGTGSHLVLHNLRNNLTDIFHQPALMETRFTNRVRKLLLAGGGTLRRMDYPAFTLVCRPTITMVRLETFAQLVDLAAEVSALATEMNMLTQSSLADWITRGFDALSPNPLPDGMSLVIADTLERHAIAYLVLKERVLREALQAAPFRLRRKHIQQFWADRHNQEAPSAIPADFAALNAKFGLDGVKEALVHALLDHFKDDWDAPQEAVQPLKETLIGLMRSVMITYHIQEPSMSFFGWEPTEEDLERTQEVANFLIQQIEHAPLELAQNLRIDPQQAMPRLAGGQLTLLERNCRRLIKEAAGASHIQVTEGAVRTFTCRPLAKIAALDRGDLAGDCSSDSVPLRALSPHHTYYGIFENDKQQRGYMTVYEAWAQFEGQAGKSKPAPMLCLETINAPLRIFDAVQQDLLVLFEAVAKSRGLADGLVLITGITTWNYHNGETLRQSRRFRKGAPVCLYPADPAGWNLYQLLAIEAQYYTAFFDNSEAQRYEGLFRILAPFQPELDPIAPENLAEAQRIAALPPGKLRLIARGEDRPAGFISEMPEIL